MEKSLAQLTEYLEGELVGDPATKIRGVAAIEEAGKGELSFLANPKYAHLLKTTSASAVIVARETSAEGIKTSLIKHGNPYFAFAKAVELFAGARKISPEGVHGTAVLGEGVKLERGVHVGPQVVVENGVRLGRDSAVLAGSFIGADSSLGEGCLVYPNVTIRENVQIGKNVIIHSGAVIGSDGFGYAREKGVHQKIPQIGGVKIEDEVEIGANVTIDRAALGTTRIGKGTKIDNLVQIGHNVDIGKRCIIVAQVGIGGSTKIGDDSIIAGQAGLVGHLNIGKKVVIGAQSGVTKDIPDQTTAFGFPAREIRKARRIEAHLSRLDLYVQRLKEVERKLKEMGRTSP